MKKIKLKCGCEVEIEIKNGAVVKTKIPENPRLDCEKTWDIYKNGMTWGCFQLETQGGQHWSEKTAPSNINELSDLIAIIRPGSKDAIIDGKSVTNHYIDRKNGKEKISYMHPSIEKMTKDTQGFIIFQETAMQVAQEIAGFDGVMAYKLCKAAAKKNVEAMVEIKKLFYDGARARGHDDESIQKIFEGIEASQRYSFNKSHSISYSLDSYLFSAYLKAHFPRAFYMGKMQFISDNEKLAELLEDAPKMGVEIVPPDIRNFNPSPVLKDKKILFPLSKIKMVSEKAIFRIKKNMEAVKGSPNYLDWMITGTNGVVKTAIENLISCGAYDHLGIPRQRLLDEFSILRDLSEGIKRKIIDNKQSGAVKTIEDIIAKGTGKGELLYNSQSENILKNKLKILKIAQKTSVNDLRVMCRWEKNLIGREVTCTELDAIGASGNMDCLQVFNLKGKQSNISLSVIIRDVKTHICKDGRPMVFLTVYDLSTSLSNVVMFADCYDKYCSKIFAGNTVQLLGHRSWGPGLIIDKVFDI